MDAIRTVDSMSENDYDSLAMRFEELQEKYIPIVEENEILKSINIKQAEELDAQQAHAERVAAEAVRLAVEAAEEFARTFKWSSGEPLNINQPAIVAAAIEAAGCNKDSR